MTNQQAKTKAQKRWGKDFYIRNSPHFSSPDRRAEAHSTTVAAREEIKRIDEEVRRRLNEMEWYQDLMKRRRECHKTVAQTEGNAMYYRFNVGKQTSYGFVKILGSGDTWEEAFAKAEQREGVHA